MGNPKKNSNNSLNFKVYDLISYHKQSTDALDSSLYPPRTRFTSNKPFKQISNNHVNLVCEAITEYSIMSTTDSRYQRYFISKKVSYK